MLYFGRLSPEKGVDDLLRAMKLTPHLHLNVAGDGPQRPELERLCEQLGLKNVHFAGHQSGADLAALIAQSQFTVFPSRAYEILGKSILESYAWGRPVVASDLGSRRELVKHAETGFLFPVGNVEQMAHAMSLLAGNPKLSEEMGAAGRDLLQERQSPRSMLSRSINFTSNSPPIGLMHRQSLPPHPGLSCTWRLSADAAWFQNMPG